MFDSYRKAILDEAIEIRLAVDPNSGRLAVAGESGIVALREDVPPHLPPPLSNFTGPIGSRVDLVA